MVLHHDGAIKYYRINIAVLFLFLGVTLYHYVHSPQVFFGKAWLANLYLFAIQGGIVGLYLFSNRHIRSLHLLKGGQSVEIKTFSNFGLTHNRARILDVSQLQGNRLFGPSSMRLFQLEYKYESSYSGITRRRSFFYRPEFIANQALWKAVRQGNDIASDEDVSKDGQKKTKQELEEMRRAAMKEQLENPKNKNSHRHKYR